MENEIIQLNEYGCLKYESALELYNLLDKCVRNPPKTILVRRLGNIIMRLENKGLTVATRGYESIAMNACWDDVGVSLQTGEDEFNTGEFHVKVGYGSTLSYAVGIDGIERPALSLGRA